MIPTKSKLQCCLASSGVLFQLNANLKRICLDQLGSDKKSKVYQNVWLLHLYVCFVSRFRSFVEVCAVICLFACACYQSCCPSHSKPKCSMSNNNCIGDQ